VTDWCQSARPDACGVIEYPSGCTPANWNRPSASVVTAKRRCSRPSCCPDRTTTTPDAGLPSIVTRPLTEARLGSLLRCCASADAWNPATNNKSRGMSGVVKRLSHISLVFIFLSAIFLSAIFLSAFVSSPAYCANQTEKWRTGKWQTGKWGVRLILLHRTIKNQTCLDSGGIILQISQSDPTHAGKASIQFRSLRLPTLFSTSHAHWRPRRLAQPVYRSFRHPARLAQSASICRERCCSTRTRRWVGQSHRHIAGNPMIFHQGAAR